MAVAFLAQPQAPWRALLDKPAMATVVTFGGGVVWQEVLRGTTSISAGEQQQRGQGVCSAALAAAGWRGRDCGHAAVTAFGGDHRRSQAITGDLGD